MEVNLLLRLLIAHLLTDFVLQPISWVDDRKEKKAKSKKLLIHIIVTTLIAYLFSGLYHNWVIPAVIFISHYMIDIIKSHKADTFRNFIVDQLAHVLIIIVLWLSVDRIWGELLPTVSLFFKQDNIWIIAFGYVLVSWPLGIIIGKGTQKWRNQIAKEEDKEKHKPSTISNDDPKNEVDSSESSTVVAIEEQELGLANAGKWIGICERILILTFVLMQQYTAIGFLMTAKSILRFSEKEKNTQLKTEYVLVGTLVSFTTSAMIGVLLHTLLK